MTKSYNGHGDPIFIVRIRSYVSKEIFAKALGEQAYMRDNIEFSTLTRTQAREILDNHLFHHGLGGAYEGLDDLGDHTDEYNSEIDVAMEWVVKNYPYLNGKKSKA
jgi:hypothetical protein